VPKLQRTDSIAANAFNSNVWTGTQFEFAPYNTSWSERHGIGDGVAVHLRDRRRTR